MLDLLRSLEWCASVEEDHAEYAGCPTCHEKQVDGHAPDCRLDRAIRELSSSAIEEVPVDEPIRVGSLVCPKPAPYKGTVWRVDRIERGRAYMTRVDQPDAPCTAEAVFPVGDVVAVEPTVDEMARQVDATIAGKRVGPWLTPPAPRVYEASGPTFADKLRALGLSPHQGDAGIYFRGVGRSGASLDRKVHEDGLPWFYWPNHAVTADLRRWLTAEAAVDELYAEWVAKQQAALGARPDSPPTDPSALAAWLYARVVPGRTVVEWCFDAEDAPLRKSVVFSVQENDCTIQVESSTYVGLAFLVPGPRVTRLLNPDGTVLWEAK